MIRIFPLLAALLTLSLSAGASAQANIEQSPAEPAKQTTTQGKARMYPPPYEPIVPGTTAPRVQPLMRQLLALTGSVRSADDLSVENIEKISGIKLTVDPDEPSWHYASQKMTDIWYYGILLKHDVKTSHRNFSLSFSVPPRANISNNYPPITDVCIDMGEFDQALLKQGYRLVGSGTPHTGGFSA